jgi:hypothetical protein
MLPALKNRKFSVKPNTSLKSIYKQLRNRILTTDQHAEHFAIFLFLGKQCMNGDHTIKELHEKYHDADDGLLYFTYAGYDYSG